MNLFKLAYKSFLETEKFRFSTRVAVLSVPCKWESFGCCSSWAYERNVLSNDSKNSEAKETEWKREIEERNGWFAAAVVTPCSKLSYLRSTSVDFKRRTINLFIYKTSIIFNISGRINFLRLNEQKRAINQLSNSFRKFLPQNPPLLLSSLECLLVEWAARSIVGEIFPPIAIVPISIRAIDIDANATLHHHHE